MKIAVTYENGQIFQHFGQTEHFKVYDIQDGKVHASSIFSTNGNGHGTLAGILQQNGVSTLICGGIGAGARQMLAAAGIQLYGGVTGDADQAVVSLLSGGLVFNPSIECGQHHNHNGSHGCGGTCANHPS